MLAPKQQQHMATMATAMATATATTVIQLATPTTAAAAISSAAVIIATATTTTTSTSIAATPTIWIRINSASIQMLWAMICSALDCQAFDCQLIMAPIQMISIRAMATQLQQQVATLDELLWAVFAKIAMLSATFCSIRHWGACVKVVTPTGGRYIVYIYMYYNKFSKRKKKEIKTFCNKKKKQVSQISCTNLKLMLRFYLFSLSPNFSLSHTKYKTKFEYCNSIVD